MEALDKLRELRELIEEENVCPEYNERLDEAIELLEATNDSKPVDEDYVYKNIEEYEEIIEQTLSDGYRIIWDMARTKMKHLNQLAKHK